MSDQDKQELTGEELDEQGGEQLPDREAMSLINSKVPPPPPPPPPPRSRQVRRPFALISDIASRSGSCSPPCSSSSSPGVPARPGHSFLSLPLPR